MSFLSAVLSVLTVASVGFTVIMILVNLHRADRSSWVMSALRVGMTLLSALIALPVTKLLAGAFTDGVYETVLLAAGDGMGEFLSATPEGLDGLRVIVSMTVALFLYILVFIVVRILFTILGVFLRRWLPALREKTRRGLAMPLGALNGILIVAVVLAPLCGFLSVSGSVLGDVSVSAAKCESEEVTDLLAQFGADGRKARKLAVEINKQPVISIVSATVGRPICAFLSGGELELSDGSGKVIDMELERDLSAIICTYLHLTDANEAVNEEDFDAEDKSRLDNLSESVDRSEWVTIVTADAMATLAERWKQRESFAGAGCPSVHKAAEPAFDSIMDVLTVQTADVLPEDLPIVLDVTGDLALSKLLSGTDDAQQLIKNVSEHDFFATVAGKLDANARFETVAGEIRLMSVRLVAAMLGEEALKDGDHDELMLDLAAGLTAVVSSPEEESRELLPALLEQTFADHGYDLPQNVATEVADQMLAGMGADGAITPDELTAYLVGLA